ncbi:transmembrane protein C1orf162 homolog [Megaptera novaeangliae]
MLWIANVMLCHLDITAAASCRAYAAPFGQGCAGGVCLPVPKEHGKDFQKPNGSSAHFLCHNSREYLVLTFLSGVLLTLLLMALVFLIIKSYRKYRGLKSLYFSPGPPHPPPRPPPTPPPHPIPSPKIEERSFQFLQAPLFSPPEEALTYANMTFKISKEKSNHLTMNHSSDSDSIVYAQIKVTNSPCLSSEV